MTTMRRMPLLWCRLSGNLLRIIGGQSLLCNQWRRMSRDVRNIGIVAHIDAGKTTTTERMLFDAGHISFLGEVDDGSTVTDYMAEERERGITIQSAAVTFHWRQHRLNLLDTPGHVDFTMEVERSLRVLDGVIVVLDATKGVQAQSLAVWRQAERHRVPRIIYLNKMDRVESDVDFCLQSIEKKFHSKPLLLQLPVKDGGGRLDGVVDLLTMEQVQWSNNKEDRHNRKWQRQPLSASGSDDAELWERSILGRIQLTEDLAEMDDELADVVLVSDRVEDVTSSQLCDALRRATLAQKGTPVCLGSSHRNVGVQLLMDAVVDYLPAPEDVLHQHRFLDHYGNDELCALVFKILHCQQRGGRLAFVRIYSGTVTPGQTVHVANRQCPSERLSSVLLPYADQFREIPSAHAAHHCIVVVTGLKNVVTGDTLTSKVSVRSRGGPGGVLAGIDAPPPVYFCSIEAASVAHQKPLEVALKQLQVEDPSFRVRVDSETGQTIVAGMGDLHLDIVRKRLQREFKVRAELGLLQVAYREVLEGTAEQEHVLDRTIGTTKHRVCLRLSVEPQIDEPGAADVGLKLAHSRDNQENLSRLKPEHLKAIESGVELALSHGPLVGHPVTNACVKLHWCEVEATAVMVSACASQLLTKLVTKAGVRLSEPSMLLEVVADEDHVHCILADLGRRRAQIVDVQGRGNVRVVRALAPLADLSGYATDLRTLSSGTATLTMELDSYVLMSRHDQQNAIRKVTGLW